MQEAIAISDADSLYRQCYLNFAVNSNDASSFGAVWYDCNILGLPSETTNFVRQLFNHNCLTTDEAICTWNDSQINALNKNLPPLNADSQNPPCTQGLYMRLVCGVMLCNKYLETCAELSPTRNAEVRFLRALNYWYIYDIFGRGPIISADNSGKKDADGGELLQLIADEATATLTVLRPSAAPSDTCPDYARANSEAALTLIVRARMASGEWRGALDACQHILRNTALSLSNKATTAPDGTQWSAYQKLFLADNGNNGAQCEFILPIHYEPDSIASWGGTTFLVGSTHSQTTPDNGLTERWTGNRARPDLVLSFDDDADQRALFYREKRTLSCDTTWAFHNGFSVMKFKNLRSDGKPAATGNRTPTYSQCDFPLMRLAEVYLSMAEAKWRLGDTNGALSTLNILRGRANAKPLENISDTGKEILDEWMREFYFEGRRRTDLVRFGAYGGQTKHRWQWMGGGPIGREFPITMNYFPLPNDSLLAISGKQISEQLYYLTGDGVGDGSWDISGGENVGRGAMPMRHTDDDPGVLIYTDYFTTKTRFKLFRDFGSWDEQFGCGDGIDNPKHNEGSSNGFVVPDNDIYTILLDTRLNLITVSYCDKKARNYDNISIAVGGVGLTPMKSANPQNKLSHLWVADIDLPHAGCFTISVIAGDSAVVFSKNAVTGLGASIPRKKSSDINIDSKNSERIRAIYNDIDKGLYLLVPTDKERYEFGYVPPEDIGLRPDGKGGATYSLPPGATSPALKKENGKTKLSFSLYGHRWHSEVPTE